MFAKESVQSFWKAATWSKPLFRLSFIGGFFQSCFCLLVLAECQEVRQTAPPPLCRARLPRHRRKRPQKLPNGVLTLLARWISLSIALSPSVFLLAEVITSSRPGRNDPRVPSN